MNKKIPALLAVISVLLCMLCGCDVRSSAKPKERVFFDYFDTVSYVYSYSGENDDSFSRRADLVESTLDKYHKLLDIYNEYDGINNLKTVNDNAGVRPVSVCVELIEFLLHAKELYVITQGETNIAMGAVLKLWHKCRSDAQSGLGATVPNEDSLKEAALHVDINDLIINENDNTVYLCDEKMSLDVGAIGKGYAADMAKDALLNDGASSYVLNFGGNLRAIGKKPGGDGWITGVTNPDPFSSQSFAAKLNLKDTSCVTSGSYERYYVLDGVRYHHIIDKDTLFPSLYFSSVTVICKSSSLADALSTALFSMSYEDGLKLVSEIGGVEVLWIDNLYNQFMTDGLRKIQV